MSIERLFLLDPYNDKQMEMLSVFEQENELFKELFREIKSIKDKMSKEEYFESKRKNNDIEETLFIEKDSKITDCCHIQGEKDIKTCKIILIDLANKDKKRKLPTLAADYALNTLGIEEVFIDVNEEDQSMRNFLEMKGFEYIGPENGKIIYLKEREELEDIKGKVA